MPDETIEERMNYEDVKYWLWTTIEQVKRLRQSFTAQMAALQSFNPNAGYSLQHQRINAQTSADMHFLLVAASNLLKATSSNPLPQAIKDNNFEPAMAKKIRSLRNIYEHWEETRETFSSNLPKKKSAKWYEDNYPAQTPWSLSQDANGFVVCGILNIDELDKALAQLESALS
jgi:hypothetical protein